MNGRIERDAVLNSIRYLDPETGMPQIEALRLAYRCEVENDRRRAKLKQILATVVLAGVLTAFWGLVMWLAEKP